MSALQTAAEFLAEYEASLDRPEYSHLESTVTSSLAYDAIWSLALALNSTLGDILDEISPPRCENFTGGFTPLENFTYSDQKVGCIVREYLQATDFTGVSVSCTVYRVLVVYIACTVKGNGLL